MSLLSGAARRFRPLRVEPVQSVLIALVLSLGIGANLAIFGALDRALLRPLPYPDGDRLFLVHLYDRDAGRVQEFTSYPVFEEWRRRTQRLGRLTAYLLSDATVTGIDRPELVQTAQVEGDFVGMLGVTPLIGRGVEAEDQAPGRDQVVVLSHAFWVRRFAAARGVLSNTLMLDGRPYAIIGVMPPGFEFPDASVDLWRPLSVSPFMRAAGEAFWAGVAGRLAPGIGLRRVQSAVAASMAGLAAQYPALRPYDVTARSFRTARLGDSRRALLFLQAAVAVLLLIACANAASLLLLRTERRRSEFATRRAMGATPWQLMAPLIAEAATLTGLGAVGGVVIGRLATHALQRVAPAQVLAAGAPGFDWRLALFDVVVSAAALLVSVLLPALRASRPDVSVLARGVGAGQDLGLRTRRARTVLVACECATAVLLLACAALFGRTVFNLVNADPGFARDGVLTAAVRLSPSAHPDRQALSQANARLIDQLRRVPGATAAGATQLVLFNEYQAEAPVTTEATQSRPAQDQLRARIDPASPDYFRVVRVPLLQGRGFDASDGPDGPLVAVVNQTLANHAWPGETPIGKRIGVWPVGPRARWMTVVGVVADMRRAGVERSAGNQLFVPLRQKPSYGLTVAVRANGDPARLAGVLREAIWKADAGAAVWDVKPLSEMLDESVQVRRFQATVLAAFGAAALALALIGVFALAHRAVAMRGRELGLRSALGAAPSDLLILVTSETLRPVVRGTLVGLAMAAAAASVVAGSLYGVTPWDPLTLLLAGGGLVLTATVATLGAGWRATRTDPATALRSL